MLNNDYFSKSKGFVIDGASRGGRERAASYLINSCDMEPIEANTYITRILREYVQNLRVGKGALVNG